MENQLTSIKYVVIKRDQFKYIHISHPEWVMYIVLGGSFESTLYGKREIMEKYDLYFIPPNEFIDRSVINPIEVAFIRFTISPDSYLYPLIPRGKVRLGDFSRLKNTVHIINYLSASPSLENRKLKYHFVSDLVFTAICEKLHNKKEKIKKNDPELYRIITYMKDNYNSPITMRDLAERFNLSPSGLIWKFKNGLSELPMRYLINIRIENAKKLLTDTSLRISAIAVGVGFDNQYYFSRAFKSEVGVTPSEYRKINTI